MRHGKHTIVSWRFGDSWWATTTVKGYSRRKGDTRQDAERRLVEHIEEQDAKARDGVKLLKDINARAFRIIPAAAGNHRKRGKVR